MNAPMKRMIILLCCLLPSIIAFGQDPKPPTQEWCEWAFKQVPDQKSLSKVDSTAFSDEFYCLLKELDRLCTWEEKTYQCKPDGADCLRYWYSDMESTRLEGDRAKVYFGFTPKSPREGEVIVTIDHPDYMNYDGTRVSKYRMSVKCEKGAWRINDWDGKWVEIALVFRVYQRFESGNVTIDSRAQAIINKYLENVELPEETTAF